MISDADGGMNNFIPLIEDVIRRDRPFFIEQELFDSFVNPCKITSAFVISRQIVSKTEQFRIAA